MIRPEVGHEVGDTADVTRAVDQPIGGADRAVVAENITRMCRRGHHATGLGQGQGRIDVAYAPTARAEPDHHQPIGRASRWARRCTDGKYSCVSVITNKYIQNKM